MKKYLVTSALPYANGPLHFGHIAGVYLPADIYTRHLKAKGEKVIHISGSDEHGVAIMLNAQKAKQEYKNYVDGWHEKHSALFKQYLIDFDFFGQTSAEYHREEVLVWFKDLHEKGYIEREDEQQLQCQSCHNYLPDRFVEGTCYECGYPDARGDECPNCGIWIDPLRLKDPQCKFCDSKDIKAVDSYQWHLKLSKFHGEFRDWFSKQDHWRKTVYPFVDSLTKENLHDRAITRDLDWGIDVPLDEAKGKKLYVWFDAPIGYVSNTKEYCKNSGEDYLTDWWQNPDTEVVHFIGKDNIIFHGIIFPMMSLASERVKAVGQLPANQYLNLDGKQFSKSQGWYIDAEEVFNHFDSNHLRYYLATLIPEYHDASFTWEGFESRVNGELINNIGNFLNRSLTFIYKNWPEGIKLDYLKAFFDTEQFRELVAKTNSFHEFMDKVEIKKGLETVMAMGQQANGFFTEREPWALVKTDKDACEKDMAQFLLFSCFLMSYIGSFLPQLQAQFCQLFKQGEKIRRFLSLGYRREFDQMKANLEVDLFLFEKKPKAMLKKIDPDLIKTLNEQLTAKA